MRIEHLDLISYGHLVDRHLDLSAPGTDLTVVFGPNEAGKSTTMRAIAALLFGIDRANTDHFDRAREGLRVGARLVGADGTVLEVVRQGIARQPLVGPDGTAVEQAKMASILGGATAALFGSLFRVDHDELRHHSKDLLDSDGELGQLVFGAGLGATRLTDVLKGLQQRRDALFLPQGRVQQVPVNVRELRELRKETRDLRTRARDWEQARDAAEAAATRVDELRHELRTARLAHERLVRLQGALPALATYRSLAVRRQQLDGAGAPSDSWALRTRDLFEQQAGAQGESERIGSELARLEQQLQALAVAEDLLAGGEHVDRLVDGTDRYMTNVTDLPRRRSELEAAESRIAELGLRTGIDLRRARTITDAQLADIDLLVTRYETVVAETERAARECTESAAAVDHQSAVLASLAEPPDAGPLRHLLQATQATVARLADLATERSEMVQRQGDVQAEAARLGLPPGVDVELQAVPDRAVLREDLEREAAIRSAMRELGERLADVEAEIDDHGRHLAVLSEAAGLPDPDALDLARRQRDSLWATVKAAVLGGPGEALSAGEVAGAYEQAVAEADGAADERFEHASQLHQLRSTRQRLQEATGRRAELEEKVAAQQQALATWRSAWDDAWVRCGLAVVAPEDGFGRVDELGDLRRAAADVRRRRASLQSHQDEGRAATAALRAALVATGAEPLHEELRALAVQAAQLADSIERSRADRCKVAEQLEEARREHAHRRISGQAAGEAAESFFRRWSDAVEVLALGGQTSAVAAQAVVAGVRALLSEGERADALRRRVVGLERDVAAYGADVDAVCRAVAADLVGTEVAVAVRALRERLAAARAASSTYQVLDAQREQLVAASAELDDTQHHRARALAHQRQLAGLLPDDDLEARLRRAEEVAEVDRAMRQVAAQLVEQGAGSSLEAVLAAGAAYGDDPAAVEVALAEAARQVTDLESQLAAASERRSASRAALDAVDGSGRAAACEQQAEVVLADLAGAAGDYARAALAYEVLRRVVADYGARHQDPLVSRAGSTFSQLTGGGFNGLVADGDPGSQRLMARRHDGHVHELHQLSEGTIDKLYLALRLAGVEHHLDQVSEPLPLVLDDILVNMDDEGTSFALQALLQLGQRTQVLLFTHHRHLVDIARRLLGDRVHVAELAPRPYLRTAADRSEQHEAEGGSVADA